MRPWDRLQDRLWVLYGYTDLCWFWIDCMPLVDWWFGWFGWAISGVDYFISVLAALDIGAPKYRMRRRKKPPDLNRYYTGKRRRYQLRWMTAARIAERAIVHKFQEQQQLAAEMAEFLDVNGLPLEEQGRFYLNQLDPEMLERFVCDELRDPTAIVRLQTSLVSTTHAANARAAWLRAEAAKAGHPAANLWMHSSPTVNNSSSPDPSVLDPVTPSTSRKKNRRRGKKKVHTEPEPSYEFLHTPAVLDTGASYGLTPFRDDFVTYDEVDVTVKGVGSENRVKGFGMVLYRAKASNGDVIFMPGLAYHMESTDIRLISPQAYHQVWSGHSVVTGSQYHLHLNKPANGIPTVSHVIETDMDSATNLPLLRDVATTPKERADIGPLFARRLGLAQKSTNGFFFGADGSWNLTRIEDEDFDTPTEVDYSFGLFDGILNAAQCTTSESNANLSAPQKELLLWHHRLGCSMKKAQYLMKPHTRAKSEGGPSVRYPPVIPTRHASTSTCDPPMCATCEIARAKVRKPESKKEKAVKKNEGALYRNKYAPGDFVSMDTISVPIKGRLFSGFGADSADSYAGVTLFHDAGSGIIRVFPQLAMTAGDSLASKIEFENFLWETAGATVKHYHSDGGVFTAEAFKNDCKLKKQEQTFSGVGAKHQNVGAERSVQTIFWMCRTFLLHAALRWSGHGCDDPELWPQALCYAEWLFNRTPSMSSGMSPMERLTGALSDHRELLRARVWGSPTYVLESRLQDGAKIPKFAARAKVGQFMGFSPSHSSMVGIVRNLTTNHMSAQYHIVVDEKFETVWGISSEHESTLDDKVNQIWTRLFTSGISRDLYVSPEYDPDTGELLYEPPPMEPDWLTPEELRDRKDRISDQQRRGKQHRSRYEDEFKKEEPLQQPSRKVVIDEHPTEFNPSAESEGDGLEDAVENDSIDRIVDTSVPSDVPTSANPWAGRIRKRRSSWKTRRDDRVNLSTSNWHAAKAFTPAQLASLSEDEKRILRDDSFAEFFGHYNITLSRDRQVPIEVKRTAAQPRKQRQTYERLAELSEQQLRAMKLEIDNIEDFMSSPLSQHIQLATNYSGYGGGVKELICDYVSPWFLNAKTGISSADNPSWEEAMNGDEAEGYWEAAKLEIATLEKMKAWDVVDRSSVPKGQRVLPGLWALKKKRLPSGEVRKLKARFTVRGDKQIAGVDFNETWAPVCKWTTVRMMFILQLMLGLKSSAADVECAFLHGTLPPEEQVYVEMPKGFVQPNKVLKLRQSLYGLKQAPRCFWEYLTKVMEENGMQQSKFDSCLFVGEKVIALAYVDDILFWSKDESDITDMMVNLRESGLMLERESDAAGFLGVDINVLEEDSNGRPTKMELTQTGLIDRIITNLGLDGTPGGKAVPAQSKPLHRDEDGPECEGDFNYAAVVGQLLYLSGHTRPDIAYAVNCCARYMFSPKQSHELALKQIGRYLRATRTRGIVITPSENLLSIDAFPDADFCGMYGVEKPNDPACVKSRTGFVICISNVPVLWMSKLQTKTALSTMEAEISALAHCCRELFPIMDISQFFTEYFKLGPSVTTMNVSVHEDNSSALILAESIPPEHTPRSKFFHLETVWFREEIVKRGIKLLKIDTKEQLGDIFTKGLPKVVFEYLRFKLCGW